MKARIAVFASGGGSNLQAMIDHLTALGESANGVIVLVASDRAASGALERAIACGISSATVDARDESAILELLRAHSVDIIALAGYTRLVPANVVAAYPGRILNVHPGTLPDFGGRGMYGERVHAAVIASGTSQTAVTVHLVNEEYDRGATLVQWPVPVLDGDSASTLGARVLSVEHIVYPRILDAMCALVSRESKSSEMV